jgi:hypothetical protein
MELLAVKGFHSDESSTGVAPFMLNDPDGNPILVDQHVPKPME